MQFGEDPVVNRCDPSKLAPTSSCKLNCTNTFSNIKTAGRGYHLLALQALAAKRYGSVRSSFDVLRKNFPTKSSAPVAVNQQ